jgi:hypothetical protein
MTNQQIQLVKRPQGMVSPDCFKLEESFVSEPGPGQVLVEVQYISLDPAMRGWMNEGTTYMPGVKLGEVMRGFAAGKIIASQDPGFQVGDWVQGLLGVQTYACCEAKVLQKLDPSYGPLSWHLGILGMPGMTAYFGLLERGKPQPGETIVVLGAAGIIGAAVGQIGKILGCRVVGTAGSAEKCRYLTEECGFDAAINYKTEDVAEALQKHCPDRIHVLFDNVGGPLLDVGLAHLARGARVVICGSISQYNESEIYGPKNYLKIVTARGQLSGIIVFDFQEQYPVAVKALSDWIKAGQIKVKEDLRQGIENFPEALKLLFKGENFGKLLLKVGESQE